MIIDAQIIIRGHSHMESFMQRCKSRAKKGVKKSNKNEEELVYNYKFLNKLAIFLNV